uniref:Uncharacterized protein n=1 Tax=CrAss-like virus sp. ctcfK29 TaxID=2826827 RepID=A0A8S5MJE4_9CAUD|nr:MAG TPA: hypothetical protein [CrAss-like virus sp. ctcfK29]
MIIFDQLRISDDGKRMYINAHVNKADYFNDIYIDSIVIQTADKVSETDPGLPTSDYVYIKKAEENVKELNLVLEASDLSRSWESDPKAIAFNRGDMSKTLFFIYIKCKGTPGSCTPCRLDEETTLGVVFDENVLHQKVMDYTKELVADCNVPSAFIDFILLWNAFKSAIETEHYIPAIKFFNMMFEEVGKSCQSRTIKTCGCNG